MNIQVPAKLDWKHSKVSCGLSLLEGILGTGSSAFYHPSPNLKSPSFSGLHHGPFQQVWVSRTGIPLRGFRLRPGSISENREVQHLLLVPDIWHGKTATPLWHFIVGGVFCFLGILFYHCSFGRRSVNSESVSPTSIHGFSVEFTQVSYILPGIEFSTVDVFVVENRKSGV